MKINVFMTLYKAKKDSDKEALIKEHIKNEYIPIEKKADYAKKLSGFKMKIKFEYCGLS